MWKTATLIAAAGMIVAIVGTEFLRAAVDKYRTRTQGMGGTQDILLLGMIAGWSCFFAAVGFGIKWWMTAE